MTPAVSVIMAVHNGVPFLREAVESVLGQEGPELELIVVDDGSTDATPAILAEYASNDRRVVVCPQARAGQSAALNRGVALARAELIARLDSDDIALPNRFERQRRFLAENARVAVVGGAVVFVDEAGRPFGRWLYPLTDAEIREALSATTPVVHSAVMMRKDAFTRVGGYRPSLLLAQDVDLWLRIAERYELANVPEEVICYRVHGGQATARQLELQTLESVAARRAERLRSEGRDDPLDAVERVDHATALAIGVTETELTSAHVGNLLWLAKLSARAGYRQRADELFAVAVARARSDSGSDALVRRAHREHYRMLREQRRRRRAILEAASAVVTFRWPRRRRKA